MTEENILSDIPKIDFKIDNSQFLSNDDDKDRFQRMSGTIRGLEICPFCGEIMDYRRYEIKVSSEGTDMDMYFLCNNGCNRVILQSIGLWLDGSFFITSEEH